MNLVNDLENDIVLAMLTDKNRNKTIDSAEVLPLLDKIKKILEPVSSKDHSYTYPEPKINEVTNSH